jgi:uncharacterized protein with gpF-like domain
MPIPKTNIESYKKYMTWKAYDNKIRSFEKYAERIFTKALRKQLNAYLNEVERVGKIDFDLEGIVTSEPIQEAFEKVYGRVMKVFAQETYAQFKEILKKEISVDWDVVISSWLIDNKTKIWNSIDDTTKKEIYAKVAIALKEGTPIPIFAKELAKTYSFSTRRGMLIGRTEIVSASNAGSLLGAKASGVPSKKIWLATQDDRTRDLHLAVDGQVVNTLDGNFQVGVDEMKYPADSSLGAAPSNTINCRCTVIYEPYDDNI